MGCNPDSSARGSRAGQSFRSSRAQGALRRRLMDGRGARRLPETKGDAVTKAGELDRLEEKYGDGTGLCRSDPLLLPYQGVLRARQRRFLARYVELERGGGLLGSVSHGHHYFGLNRGEREGVPGIWYREWAPAARQLSLIGDFNGWDRGAHRLERNELGVWSLFLPEAGDAARLTHESRVKVHVVTERGAMDRIPAYIRRTVQDPVSKDFSGQFWDPPEPYRFLHPMPPRKRSLRIYEAHVGMAQEEGKVGSSYAEFTRDVLPHIAELGYNALQLMAVMEHPYYGSFGYHVSSFFAVSSRFGTPDELKELIDAAHALGISRAARPRAQPRRAQHARGAQRVRRHRPPVLPRAAARLARGLGLDGVRLRQVRGAALSAQQRALLAGGVPLRRLPLRRHHQHALPRPRPRAQLLRLRRLLWCQRRRRRRHLPEAGQRADARALPRQRDHRRGCLGHAGHGARGRRGRASASTIGSRWACPTTGSSWSRS